MEVNRKFNVMAIYEVKKTSNGVVVESDCLYHGEFMVDPAEVALWHHDTYEVVVPEGTTKLKPKAFLGCKEISKITIPDSVTSIGAEAFSGCENLKEVVLPKGLKKIGRDVFCRCTGLTNIVIPEGVTEIGEYAFYKCSSLQTINIPEGVKKIESRAFNHCEKLTTITLPASVRSIKTNFLGCKELENIIIAEGNKFFEFRDNCLIEKKENILLCCPSLTSVVIPEGVTEIGDGAFKGCTGLTSIKVPAGNVCHFKELLNDEDLAKLVVEFEP